MSGKGRIGGCTEGGGGLKEIWRQVYGGGVCPERFDEKHFVVGDGVVRDTGTERNKKVVANNDGLTDCNIIQK